jgi:hypothetical protein
MTKDNAVRRPGESNEDWRTSEQLTAHLEKIPQRELLEQSPLNDVYWQCRNVSSLPNHT